MPVLCSSTSSNTFVIPRCRSKYDLTYCSIKPRPLLRRLFRPEKQHVFRPREPAEQRPDLTQMISLSVCVFFSIHIYIYITLSIGQSVLHKEDVYGGFKAATVPSQTGYWAITVEKNMCWAFLPPDEIMHSGVCSSGGGIIVAMVESMNTYGTPTRTLWGTMYYA